MGPDSKAILAWYKINHNYSLNNNNSKNSVQNDTVDNQDDINDSETI